MLIIKIKFSDKNKIGINSNYGLTDFYINNKFCKIDNLKWRI